MDDIVTRLRGYDWMRDGDIPDVIMSEAADEIERLRKLVTEAGKSLSHVSVLADMMQKSEDELIEIHHGKCAEQFAEQSNEIEDLRAELAEFRHQYRALKADRDRWAKWGEHVFTCPNKGINPCRDCVSPATADAMSRVDKGGAW